MTSLKHHVNVVNPLFDFDKIRRFMKEIFEVVKASPRECDRAGSAPTRYGCGAHSYLV